MGRIRNDAHFTVVQYGRETEIDTNDYNLDVLYEDDYFDKDNESYTKFFMDMMFKKNITITTLSKLSGIEASTLYKLFRNQRKWNTEYIKRLCNAFGMNIKIEEHRMDEGQDEQRSEPEKTKTITEMADEISCYYRSLKKCNMTQFKRRKTEHVCMVYGISPASFKRYVRIAQLDTGLKQLLNNNLISVMAAVELSYMKHESQKNTYNVINQLKVHLTQPQAAILKKSDAGKKRPLTCNSIEKILIK